MGIDEGGGVDFGGDAWRGPNDGMGLILDWVRRRRRDLSK
jgi:hypothetical protein